uniref:Killer cell lectin-like receptor subfamily B member 1B allele C isoform X1 n=1 Tax=Pogona vitticeps TaxID=103695 RepID=A0A6J0VBX6_9SAUR
MEDDSGYTALNFQPHRRGSQTLCAAGKQDAPQCPRWHRITLWVGFIWNIILVAIVIVLAVHLEKGKSDADVGRAKCSTSLDDFQARLNRELCNQSQDRSSVNSTCRICPVNWLLYRDKCYWRSEDMKRWKESQADCATKNSHLVVIQDEEEMKFIKQNMQDKSVLYWIGLYSSLSEEKWASVTGSQLDPNILPSDTKRNHCGVIKDNIRSDSCSAEHVWICEREALLL